MEVQARGKPRKGYRFCGSCEKNRSERFFAPSGKTCSSCRKKARSKSTHESRVTETYGLLSGEYDKLLKEQGGSCSICKQTRSGRLDVDHCHKTGQVRGLLCARCNRQLLARGLRDSPEIALSAYRYLNDPPAPRIIGVRLHKDHSK
ncbi:endonuclease VII domain-containing protein [Streptomyces yunnanensis]|uniref:Endonuclease VII domain-containing protein n=1 Tax=Streptomyces yunnanensis TaxID=156453 RepID=A0ABY8A4X1_9ACTN|nr:endonuclease domain-containing protein [Streptomyces yunnanensis]WEB38747.1 endonuclease VII domain-containing protein [Streptomyces yunnanensis]